MMLAAAMGSFGLFLLLIAIALLNGQRSNRRQLQRVRRQMERMVDELRTPEEREALRRRIEEIEAQKRTVFGRHDSGGG